jgi:hypothetical protein
VTKKAHDEKMKRFLKHTKDMEDASKKAEEEAKK